MGSAQLGNSTGCTLPVLRVAGSTSTAQLFGCAQMLGENYTQAKKARLDYDAIAQLTANTSLLTQAALSAPLVSPKMADKSSMLAQIVKQLATTAATSSATPIDMGFPINYGSSGFIPNLAEALFDPQAVGAAVGATNFGIYGERPSNSVNKASQSGGALEEDASRISSRVEKVSRVVHLRNIPDDMTELELLHFCAPFGRLCNYLMLKGKNQAFVEYESEVGAQKLVNVSTLCPISVRGRTMFCQYSLHQSLKIEKRKPIGSTTSATHTGISASAETLWNDLHPDAPVAISITGFATTEEVGSLRVFVGQQAEKVCKAVVPKPFHLLSLPVWTSL